MTNDASWSSCGTLLRHYREQAKPTVGELRLRRHALAAQAEGLTEEELGARVTRKRGLTQEELVARSGLSVEGLRKIERDRVCPFDDTILVLARALRLSNPERETLLAAAGRARATRAESKIGSGIRKMPPVVSGDRPAARVTHLPIPPTSFVGRQDVVAQLVALLHEQPDAPNDNGAALCRLLTLTGPGGCGKSRLALAVAEQLQATFADGVYLVELASLPPTGAEVSPIEQAVAAGLGITSHVRRISLAALIETLRDKELLLVLDNLEHLVDACRPPVAALLRACPGLRILTTSREALGIAGEWVRTVPPLSLPVTDRMGLLTETEERSEAVTLFVERARTHIPGFSLDGHSAAAVAAICRQLDGLPLAIELAAACLPALSLSDLAARLDDRFALLSRGNRAASPRQRTLRATMDWSYRLLPPTAAALLRRLAPFTGGWTFAASAYVCVDAVLPDEAMLDALFILVERSLVQATPSTLTGGGSARYGMLETVRAYANVLLLEEEGPAQARSLRCRHLAYYQHLAECPAGRSAAYVCDDPLPPLSATSCVSRHGDQSLTTVYEDPAIRNEPTTAWLNTVVLEEDNLRAALDFAMAESLAVEQGLQLAAALWPFWLWRGALREGRRRLIVALEASDTKGWRHATTETLKAHDIRYRARAEALYGVGRLTDGQGTTAQARAAFEECAVLRHALEGV